MTPCHYTAPSRSITQNLGCFLVSRNTLASPYSFSSRPSPSPKKNKQTDKRRAIMKLRVMASGIRNQNGPPESAPCEHTGLDEHLPESAFPIPSARFAPARWWAVEPHRVLTLIRMISSPSAIVSSFDVSDPICRDRRGDRRSKRARG